MFNIDNGYLEGLCRGFKNGEGISEVNWAVIFLSSYNSDKRTKNNNHTNEFALNSLLTSRRSFSAASLKQLAVLQQY